MKFIFLIICLAVFLSCDSSITIENSVVQRNFDKDLNELKKSNKISKDQFLCIQYLCVKEQFMFENDMTYEKLLTRIDSIKNSNLKNEINKTLYIESSIRNIKFDADKIEFAIEYSNIFEGNIEIEKVIILFSDILNQEILTATYSPNSIKTLKSRESAVDTFYYFKEDFFDEKDIILEKNFFESINLNIRQIKTKVLSK